MHQDQAHTAEGGGAPAASNKGCGLFLMVFCAVLAALLVAGLLLGLWLFPSSLQPVELRDGEKQALNQKLQQLGYQDQAFVIAEGDERRALQPRPYSEQDASREIRFSERELNGLLAKNTGLARKLAIDLSDDLASARLVLPLDPDFPVLGGQTLRMSAGMEARYEQGRPIIRLRGVSLWGVPLPNAWLGNLKQVDLVGEFGEQDGFWKQFAAGLDEISIAQGHLYIRLRE